MIPQAVIAVLACARLGAIHYVGFGGFAPNELAIHINNAKPNVIVTAFCGIGFQRLLWGFIHVINLSFLTKKIFYDNS
jgi:propionyl-CoA synthetase